MKVKSEKRVHHSVGKVKSYQGFTLIELLVVISIIGILAAMVTVSFTQAQKQARDTQRKSDLAQYMTALEAYANAHDGLYPGSSDYSMHTVCTNALSGYAATCPEDPTPSTKYYAYVPNTWLTGSPATKYAILVACDLESVPNTTWEVCSSGKIGAQTHTGAETCWTNWSTFCPF